MLNQVDVQRKVVTGGNKRFDERVRLAITAFFGQQFHAAQNPKDVRIHRKNGLLTGEQQDTTRSLWPHTFQR